jgi:hypothetical protein
MDLPFKLISGVQYVDMLHWVQSVASHLVLVTYPSRPLQHPQLLSDLSPWAASSRDAGAWPGSQLGLGKLARLATYRFDADVTATILNYSNSIADWGYPFLPDDPHWLRADGTLVIGTTVHEDRLWAEVTPSEGAALLSALQIRQ